MNTERNSRGKSNNLRKGNYCSYNRRGNPRGYYYGHNRSWRSRSSNYSQYRFPSPPKRPPSPLPGTEEHRQRNIQQTSELIKKQLNIDSSTCDNSTINLPLETEAVVSETVEIPQPSTSSSEPKKIRRQKAQDGEDIDVQKIYDKIIKHISNLSYARKLDLINRGNAGYDLAIQQVQKQKQLELSRALRDMSKRPTQSDDGEVINEIIPDIGIKLEELPSNVIEELSKTLQITFDQNDVGNLVDPEMCFKQAEELLNNAFDNNCGPSDPIDNIFDFEYLNKAQESQLDEMQDYVRDDVPDALDNFANDTDFNFANIDVTKSYLQPISYQEFDKNTDNNLNESTYLKSQNITISKDAACDSIDGKEDIASAITENFPNIRVKTNIFEPTNILVDANASLSATSTSSTATAEAFPRVRINPNIFESRSAIDNSATVSAGTFPQIQPDTKIFESTSVIDNSAIILKENFPEVLKNSHILESTNMCTDAKSSLTATDTPHTPTAENFTQVRINPKTFESTSVIDSSAAIVTENCPQVLRNSHIFESTNMCTNEDSLLSATDNLHVAAENFTEIRLNPKVFESTSTSAKTDGSPTAIDISTTVTAKKHPQICINTNLFEPTNICVHTNNSSSATDIVPTVKSPTCVGGKNMDECLKTVAVESNSSIISLPQADDSTNCAENISVAVQGTDNFTQTRIHNDTFESENISINTKETSIFEPAEQSSCEGEKICVSTAVEICPQVYSATSILRAANTAICDNALPGEAVEIANPGKNLKSIPVQSESSNIFSREALDSAQFFLQPVIIQQSDKDATNPNLKVAPSDEIRAEKKAEISPRKEKLLNKSPETDFSSNTVASSDENFNKKKKVEKINQTEKTSAQLETATTEVANIFRDQVCNIMKNQISDIFSKQQASFISPLNDERYRHNSPLLRFLPNSQAETHKISTSENSQMKDAQTTEVVQKRWKSPGEKKIFEPNRSIFNCSTIKDSEKPSTATILEQMEEFNRKMSTAGSENEKVNTNKHNNKRRDKEHSISEENGIDKLNKTIFENLNKSKRKTKRHKRSIIEKPPTEINEPSATPNINKPSSSKTLEESVDCQIPTKHVQTREVETQQTDLSKEIKKEGDDSCRLVVNMETQTVFNKSKCKNTSAQTDKNQCISAEVQAVHTSRSQLSQTDFSGVNFDEYRTKFSSYLDALKRLKEIDDQIHELILTKNKIYESLKDDISGNKKFGESPNHSASTSPSEQDDISSLKSKEYKKSKDSKTRKKEKQKTEEKDRNKKRKIGDISDSCPAKKKYASFDEASSKQNDLVEIKSEIDIENDKEFKKPVEKEKSSRIPQSETKKSEKRSRSGSKDRDLANQSEKNISDKTSNCNNALMVFNKRYKISKGSEPLLKSDDKLFKKQCCIELNGIPDKILDDVKKNKKSDKEMKEILKSESEGDRTKDTPLRTSTPTNSTSLKSTDPDCSKTRNNSKVIDKTEFKGITGSIFALKAIGDVLIAASENGMVYFFDVVTNDLLNSLSLSTKPLTALFVTNTNDGCLIYVSCQDEYLRIVNYEKKLVRKTVEIGVGVQCLDVSWSFVFLGTINGQLIIYDTKADKLNDPIQLYESRIYALKTAQEGARRVLLIGARNNTLCVRDAMTGLLLRTMHTTETTPTIYSILLDRNMVYCGTNQHDVLVYSFQEGELIKKYDSIEARRVVCMQIVGNLIFVGCFNGSVCVFDKNNHRYLGHMTRPGEMLLSMQIVKNKVIIGTKNQKLVSWDVPSSYLERNR